MSVALTLTPLSAADAPFPEACAAFLSLTMYAPPEFSLVDGPTGRYSIGDRTPGLQVGDVESVTIVMQHDEPGPDEAQIWPPAPTGPFRPIMRMYMSGTCSSTERGVRISTR